MAIKYAFDLYPRANPVAGARVLRFSKLQEAEYRGEANGTGSGRIVIRGTETQAASIDPRGMDYIRVVRIDTAVVDGATLSGFSEEVVGGFFLENGDFEALTERSTKKLTFGGSGALSYLQRAQMWSHSYFVGGDDPRDGVWQDTPVNPDHTLGFILWRWMLNAQAFQAGAYNHEHWDGIDYTDTHADDRTVNPLPDLTLGFDGDLDSDGTAWTLPFGALSIGVGASMLQAVRLFMENGLYLEMDPDTFELNAWETANHGRVRTGVAWGTNVIRFQAPSAATVATGNIKSDAKRAIAAKIKRSIILAGSGNIYGISTTGGYDIPWEGFYPSQAEDTTLLEATAAVQLGARSDAGDTVRLRGKLGNSPTTGEYLPFEHALLDDLSTLHTGTGQWDWNETDQKVAAITLKQRQGGDWDVWYDLGSTYVSIAERGFQAGTSGGSSLRLCDPSFGNLLLGLGDDVLKASGVQPTREKHFACDGDEGTHWSPPNFTDPTADHFWAADLSVAQEARGFRLKFQDTGDPLDLDVYGSNVAAAWAWLSDGSKVSGDPAVNDWTLVNSQTNLPVSPGDTGDVSFAPVSYRYWLFHAVAGGTAAGNEFDIDEVELLAPGAGHSPRAARCDHAHHHADILGRGAGESHPATAVSITPFETIEATNVQAALEEIFDEAAGGSVNISHLITATTFPIIAHRGDVNPDDGYPENTLEAIRQAATRGAHGVEFDLWRSSEGTWHAMHDESVARTTDGTGDITAKTDANIAALNIDGGYGYDAGRHGTSLNVPTLAQIIAAVKPYDLILWFDLNESGDAAATDLAGEIVAAGLEERAIILVNGSTQPAAIEAVSSIIQVACGSAVETTIEDNPDIDRFLGERAEITNAAFVNSRNPKSVDAYESIATGYGTDETTFITNMWDRGVRSLFTTDLPNALLIRNEVVLDITGGTPATTVEDETTWGITPAVGIDTEYARQDHTHGTPDEPAGGGIGEILISDAPSTPLIFADLLQNEAQNDLIYGDP